MRARCLCGQVALLCSLIWLLLLLLLLLPLPGPCPRPCAVCCLLHLSLPLLMHMAMTALRVECAGSMHDGTIATTIMMI